MTRVVWGFAFLIAFAVNLAANDKACAREKEGTDTDKKRVKLWQALEKALPEKYRSIGAYAENPSCTVVLFYSPGSTLALRFALKSGRVEEIVHMKALGPVNRITFEEEEGRRHWVLWINGQRELILDESEK